MGGKVQIGIVMKRGGFIYVSDSGSSRGTSAMGSVGRRAK